MISQIQINNFRNYNLCRINCNKQIVVLYGKNGSGKTNILEAISLFACGRGLRNAQYDSIINKNSSNNFWSVQICFGPHRMTSVYTKENNRGRRAFKIDDLTVKNPDIFAKDYYILWMTYETDRLFLHAPSNRRAFIDMLCYSIFQNHEKHIADYEQLSRERKKILAQYSYENLNSSDIKNNKWLDIVEKKLVDSGVEIIKNRMQIAEILDSEQISYEGFPSFTNNMSGPIEDFIKNNKTEDCLDKKIKDFYSDNLKQSREKDFFTKSTSIGPNKSDWHVHHCGKNISASLCSAGEQKITLIAIFLSFMMYKLNNDTRTMIILLDDVITHLDKSHQESLFEIIKNITRTNTKIQVWLSGVNKTIFDSFCDDKLGTSFIDIENTHAECSIIHNNQP